MWLAAITQIKISRRPIRRKFRNISYRQQISTELDERFHNSYSTFCWDDSKWSEPPNFKPNFQDGGRPWPLTSNINKYMCRSRKNKFSSMFARGDDSMGWKMSSKLASILNSSCRGLIWKRSRLSNSFTSPPKIFDGGGQILHYFKGNDCKLTHFRLIRKLYSLNFNCNEILLAQISPVLFIRFKYIITTVTYYYRPIISIMLWLCYLTDHRKRWCDEVKL